MAARLFIGNLGFGVGEAAVEAFFKEKAVNVEKVQVMRDTTTGKSRGFGFVQLPPGEDVAAAIQAANGQDLDGRPVTVNEAREQTRSPHSPNRPFGGGAGNRGGRKRGF